MHFKYILLLFCLCTLNAAPTLAQYQSRFLAGSARGFAEGTGAAAQFDEPNGMAADGAGNLFVADYTYNRIRKVVITTGQVTSVAGGTRGDRDGIGNQARFFGPYGMTYDGAGNLYFTDMNNYRIRQLVVATGQVTTVAGDGTLGFADGFGQRAQFSTPQGIVYDGAGNLFVADLGNNRIRKVEIATGQVTTLAGGVQGSDDGIGTSAQFAAPTGIAYDGAGVLYVTEFGNSRIRKVVIATGQVTTVAGSTRGFADGTGASAKFISPAGIAIDGAGNLLVVDKDNHSIRKIVLATGQVTTVAGATQGYQEGIGSNALYDKPIGVTFLGNGVFVTTETGNHKLRFLIDQALAVSPTIALNNSFSLTPNPATSTVQVSWQMPTSCKTITLNDLNGKVLRTYSATHTSLSLDGIKPGLYIVQVGQLRSRLVVE